MITRLLVLVTCVLLSFASLAAEPVVDATQMPRLKPTEPKDVLATFRVKAGFRVELTAAEPLVVDPIALSFDEDGRLYVVEMRDYSERRPEQLGRIRRLEDTDGDGRFDRSTVFAQGLPWPTAVICYGGGVFVGATPDVYWMRDVDGDGKADEREVTFSGFASDFAPFETNKLNVQAMLNSFNWTLDNRIHGATSFNGGKVRRVDSAFVRGWRERAGVPNAPAAPSRVPPGTLELRGRDFSFDPRTLEMRAESGGGQHGLSFDDRGRKFVCSNSSHVQALAYEERYAGRNPHYLLPRVLRDIAVDGGAAPVFRISPDEPWRVLRTQWRVAGLVPGPIEGGGKPSGYFTGATGVTLYRGDAYGQSFVGDAFVGDAGGNLVHRKKIISEGVEVKAERPADEQKVEFLASTDNWFRPVQFANAPDGCLYICDMYREVIEHPWSLPQSLKRHLDLNSGNDRGRIYRVVPDGFRQPKPPRLSALSTTGLVVHLESPNGWHRDTAARLLYERQDSAAVTALRGLLQQSGRPLARMHALYVLAGLGKVVEQDLIRSLGDDSAEVRLHAVRLSERFLSPNIPSETLITALVRLATDGDDNVRRQLAFTAGFLPRDGRMQIAVVLSDDGRLAGCLDALLSSMGDEAIELFGQLARPGLGWAGRAEILAGVAGTIGARSRPDELATVVDTLAGAVVSVKSSPGDSAALLRIAASFAAGLVRSGSSLAKADSGNRLAVLFDVARRQAEAGDAVPAELREPALEVLGAAPYTVAAPALLVVMENRPAEASRALAALGRHPGADLARELLQRWPRWTPAVRAEVLALLLKRTERVRELLAAVERGSVQPGEIPPAQQITLRTHRDAAVRELAVKVLGRAADGNRQAVVDRFLPALELRGNATGGRAIFLARCATCHRLGGDGHPLGPDLATVKNAGKEKLLTNLIDPNREMNGNFVGYEIETRDGESLAGIIASENAGSVTLRLAGGVETSLPRSNIASLRSQGRSLMPEGLEEGLSLAEMADLLEFIVSGADGR